MIKYKNISVYFNGKTILKNINLEILKNDKLIIKGKSGSGKTTLFNLLLGFSLPGEGEIFFEGNKINSRTIWQLRKKIAYVSQDIKIGRGTVIDIIKGYFKLKANSSINLDLIRLNKLFTEFDLNIDLLRNDENELSGGERQRIAIIMSILLERKIFLLDEVTSALDLKLKKKVIDFFLDNNDYTVISISHDSEWENKENVKIYDIEERRFR